jgi:SAM-dependent methyltransferase
MTQDDHAARDAGAAIFADPDVAACYPTRPPYAPQLFDFLCALPQRRDRALDIGCGPGPVARALAERFGEVIAVDPSAAMIDIARRSDAPRNIAWVQARAEDFEDAGRFDLVTAGASIHWTDPALIFPRLARWSPLLAILDNDPIFPLPAPPCGLEAWLAFLSEWYARTGRTLPQRWLTPDPAAVAPLGPHGAWLDIHGRQRFAFTFHQSVEDFIASCHSRVSWHRRMMGGRLAAEFDAALDALMRPFAVAGVLGLEVVSEVVWGRAKTTPACPPRESPDPESLTVARTGRVPLKPQSRTVRSKDARGA